MTRSTTSTISSRTVGLPETDVNYKFIEPEDDTKEKSGFFQNIVKSVQKSTERFRSRDHILHEEYKLYYPHTVVLEPPKDPSIGEELEVGTKSLVVKKNEGSEELYTIADDEDELNNQGAFFYHTIRVEKEISASELTRRHPIDKERQEVHRGRCR
jgi:hypothetical protein